MTIPAERTSAVLRTREFLIDLMTKEGIPAELRKEAHALLRHYPSKFDMDIIAKREDGSSDNIVRYKVFGEGL